MERSATDQRWAGLSAVAGFVLFAAANALWAFEQPAPDAGAQELVAFYTDTSDRIVVGGLLSLMSIGILAVFAAAIRRVLLVHSGLLADVAFAGALIGLAPGIGAETINAGAAMRAGDGDLTPELALALFDVSYVLGSYGVGLGFGLLTLAIGLAGVRHGMLPRWLGYAGVAIGVACFTPLAALVIGEYTAGPPLLFVLAVGAVLLRDRGAVSPRP